jgi:hypothetical protein
MGRKLEWELSGKSDVPQKMAQAKASVEGLEGAANAVGKKFREAFKDIALGFIAPMVLVQKAIGFIGEAIENRKRQAQEALDFADTAEAKLYATNQEIEAAKRRKEQEKSEEDKKKAEGLKIAAKAQFFTEAPEGRAFLEEQVKNPYTGLSTLVNASGVLDISRVATQLAEENKVLPANLQAAFDRFFGNTAAQRAAVDAEKAAKDGGAKAVADVGSNVIGVGMSPQLDIANRQLVVQEDMANSLRQIIESDQARQGFRPTKQPDFGGAPARTIFPR